MELKPLTPEEFYALEREARRMRSQEVGRLMRIAAASVKQYFARDLAVRPAKAVRHA